MAASKIIEAVHETARDLHELGLIDKAVMQEYDALSTGRQIASISANDDGTLDVCFASGEVRRYDVSPLLNREAFRGLEDAAMFKTAGNGGYFVSWDNDADLSADTLYLEGAPLPPTAQPT